MATTTKTIKKTTYLVSNIVSFIILESIVQTFRKLAASTTCGYCNNFGYKCTVKITGADDKVNGEMVEYNRKEPESGICMWSKKCDNAQCILRYAGKVDAGKFYQHLPTFHGACQRFTVRTLLINT